MKLHNFDFSKKLFFHPEQIVDYKQGKRPFPVTVEIDLTNLCNHKCNFCFYAEHLAVDRSSVNTSRILEILKEAKELGAKGVSFTGGGEPMIHKDFMKILAYANNIGLDCGLITNGSAITSNKIKDLIQNLKWIRISMGGGNSDSYKQVQGIDHFDKVINNIKQLSVFNSKSDKKLNIGVRILVKKENLNSLENLKEKLKDIKINYLQLAPDMFTKDGGKFWNSPDTRKVFDNIEESFQGNEILLLTAGYLQKQDMLDYPRTCYAHFFQVAITAEGNLTYCKNARDEEKFIVGNINQQSLRDIWDSEKNKQIERWVKPSNCGMFCKNMQLNNALEETLYPDDNMSPNFVS